MEINAAKIILIAVVGLSFQSAFAYKMLTCNNEQVGFTANRADDYLSERILNEKGEWATTYFEFGPTEQRTTESCEREMTYTTSDHTKTFTACLNSGLGLMLHPVTGIKQELQCNTYDLKD